MKPMAEYFWMDGLPIAVVRPKPGTLPTAKERRSITWPGTTSSASTTTPSTRQQRKAGIKGRLSRGTPRRCTYSQSGNSRTANRPSLHWLCFAKPLTRDLSKQSTFLAPSLTEARTGSASAKAGAHYCQASLTPREVRETPMSRATARCEGHSSSAWTIFSTRSPSCSRSCLIRI
jgi:hypothetical protein